MDIDNKFHQTLKSGIIKSIAVFLFVWAIWGTLCYTMLTEEVAINITRLSAFSALVVLLLHGILALLYNIQHSLNHLKGKIDKD